MQFSHLWIIFMQCTFQTRWYSLESCLCFWLGNMCCRLVTDNKKHPISTDSELHCKTTHLFCEYVTERCVANMLERKNPEDKRLCFTDFCDLTWNSKKWLWHIRGYSHELMHKIFLHGSVALEQGSEFGAIIPWHTLRKLLGIVLLAMLDPA